MFLDLYKKGKKKVKYKGGICKNQNQNWYNLKKKITKLTIFPKVDLYLKNKNLFKLTNNSKRNKYLLPHYYRAAIINKAFAWQKIMNARRLNYWAYYIKWFPYGTDGWEYGTPNPLRNFYINRSRNQIEVADRVIKMANSNINFLNKNCFGWWNTKYYYQKKIGKYTKKFLKKFSSKKYDIKLKKKLFKLAKKHIFFNKLQKAKKQKKKKKKKNTTIQIIVKKILNKPKKFIKLYFYKNAKLFRRWECIYLNYNKYKKLFLFKTKTKKKIQVWKEVIFYKKSTVPNQLYCFKFKNKKERFKFLDKINKNKIKKIQKWRRIFHRVSPIYDIDNLYSKGMQSALYKLKLAVRNLSSIYFFLQQTKKKLKDKIIYYRQIKKKTKTYFNNIKKIKTLFKNIKKTKSNSKPLKTNKIKKILKRKKNFVYNRKPYKKLLKYNKKQVTNKYTNNELKKKKKFKKKNLLFWFFFKTATLKKYKVKHTYKKHLIFFKFLSSLINSKKKKKKKKNYIKQNKFKNFFWSIESKLNIFLIRAGFVKNLNQANYLIQKTGILINNTIIKKNNYTIKINNLIQIPYMMNLFFKRIEKIKESAYRYILIQNFIKKTKSPFYLEINKKINSCFVLFKPYPKKIYVKNIKKFNFFFYKFFFFFFKKKTI